jgi:hypothetical protein
MKKTLLLIFIGAVILAAALLGIVKVRSASVTLYDCYNQLGKPWTSVFERASDAAYYGIWQYRGTAEQNTKLTSYMCPNDGMVGYSVATGYEKNLRATITGSQTTIPVTSLTLKDGTALDIDVLGGKVFLTLEPGSATREEIVMCEGINTSSLNFTSCTRGLAFSGTSTAAVTANQKSHSAGSKVVMSNVHYVYEQYADVNNNDQTLAGNKTWTGNALFYSFPTVSSSAYTGLPTNDGQLATKYYVDTVGAGGFTAANVSTTRGLSVDGSSPERVGINVSTTMGMAFDASGKLYQKVSSTKGIASDSNGIYLDTAQARTWTGQHTFTVTTTLATTTVTTLNATAINIGTTSTAPLVNGAVTTLHQHDDSTCEIGPGFIAKNIAAGTTTITTGIDANYISFDAAYDNGGASSYTSHGVYSARTGGNYSIAHNAYDLVALSSINVMMSYNGAFDVTAKVTATSTTGFSLYHGTMSNNGDGWHFLWTACK